MAFDVRSLNHFFRIGADNVLGNARLYKRITRVALCAAGVKTRFLELVQRNEQESLSNVG